MKFDRNNLTARQGFENSPCNIMIVDDEPDIREILKIVVEAEGHSCIVAFDGEMAYDLIRKEEPDVVITDVDMPKMDGIQLIRLIKAETNADAIVMTGFANGLSYTEFIEIGASDFVQKPVRPTEMVTRLNRVLKERWYRMTAEAAHEALVATHKELQSSYLDTIHRLVLAAEYKDEDTGDHIIRIGRFSSLMADQVGLSEREVRNIGYAAPMHDIGKIGIPDQILLKPGKLTDEEFNIMKTHTSIGAKILANSKSDIIRCAQQIAVSHHERWNGTGYPRGAKGDRIPITGRIVALADTFDALTSRRPYKDPYPLALAVKIMKESRGTQFDPALLDLFLKNIDEVVAIKKEVKKLDQRRIEDIFLSERDRETFGMETLPN